jgi:hypothetical protein
VLVVEHRFAWGLAQGGEGCGAGAGVKSFSANDLRADAAQKAKELSRGCHSVVGRTNHGDSRGRD